MFVFYKLFNEVHAQNLKDKNVFQIIDMNLLFFMIIGTMMVMLT